MLFGDSATNCALTAVAGCATFKQASSRNTMRDGLLYLPVASHDDVSCREEEQPALYGCGKVVKTELQLQQRNHGAMLDCGKNPLARVQHDSPDAEDRLHLDPVRLCQRTKGKLSILQWAPSHSFCITVVQTTSCKSGLSPKHMHVAFVYFQYISWRSQQRRMHVVEGYDDFF
jgi:hypothetical protein